MGERWQWLWSLALFQAVQMGQADKQTFILTTARNFYYKFCTSPHQEILIGSGNATYRLKKPTSSCEGTHDHNTQLKESCQKVVVLFRFIFPQGWAMRDEDQPCRHHSASPAMELNDGVPHGEVTHRSRTGKRQLGQHLSRNGWKCVSLKEQQAKVVFFLPLTVL